MPAGFLFAGGVGRGIAKGGATAARGLSASGKTGVFSTGGTQAGKLMHISGKWSVDTHKVLSTLERKNRKVFYRLGGYCMQVMRRSMRPGGKKGKKSQPGEPPRYHEKTLRRLIFWGIKPHGLTLVVGPELFRQSSAARQKLHGSITTVPQLLNEGGKVTLKRARFVPGGTKQRYLPRPFIDPVQKVGNAKWKELLRTVPFK